MNNKIFMISAVLSVFLIFPAFGESIKYVDMDQARKEINEKKTANDGLTKSLLKLYAENRTLNADIDAYFRLIQKIDIMLLKMNFQIEKMQAAVSGIEDKEYGTKMNGIYEQNVAVKDELIIKRNDIEAKIKEKKDKVSENAALVNQKTEEIKANNDRILYLEIAMEKTKALESRMAVYTDAAGALKQEIEKEMATIGKTDSGTDNSK
jgi:hypothetical protein